MEDEFHRTRLLVAGFVADSRRRNATDPRLRRIVFHSTQIALRRTFPVGYARKCHVAAASIATLLRRLSIRSTLVAGAVSWRFGGRGPDGTPVECHGGFDLWEDGLPPHHWVETEFGEFVDLSCSFFHRAIGEKLAGYREHDFIPPIWARREVLARLPSLRYEAGARYAGVDLAGSDAPAREAIASAEEALAASARRISEDDPLAWGPLLADEPSLHVLLAENAWVRRNSRP